VLEVGSEDLGQTIIGHGQIGNGSNADEVGPDADEVGPDADEVSPTTHKTDSRSYATVVRGTKRFARPE
jgi:hypothetical protein